MFQSDPVSVQQVILMIIYLFIIWFIDTYYYIIVLQGQEGTFMLNVFGHFAERHNNVEKGWIKTIQP